MNVTPNQNDWKSIKRNRIFSVKDYSRVDIESYHNPIIEAFRLNLKAIQQSKEDTNIDVTKLKHNEIGCKTEELIMNNTKVTNRQNMNNKLDDIIQLK